MAQHRLASAILALLLALLAATGSAQETFRITQVFSTLDGSIQFVELTESAGLNGQHRFSGLSLTSTYQGVVKRFTFPRDLPTDQTAHRSIVVSGGVLPGIPPGSILAWVERLPPRFIPTDGGTLDFAGMDRVSFARLPTDGNALYRDGSVGAPALPSNGLCHAHVPCPASRPLVGDGAAAVEYYHAGRDHYFITASAPDIDALDSGRLAGWERTGDFFWVSSSGASPVCRFYIPESLGDSHFYSASPAECDEVRARFPGFTFESPDVFRIDLPDPVTGLCPPDDPSGFLSVPIYRLWNQRADSNHRYTTRSSARDYLVARGWLAEGYGSTGIAMCGWRSYWDF